MYKQGYKPWKHRPVAMGLVLLCMGIFLPRMGWAQLVQVEQVSQPAGFVSQTDVVEVGTGFTTLIPSLTSNGYVFGYWTSDGQRLADAQGRSVVQATVDVTGSLSLTAYYFLESEDSDSDGVRDWFEWRNFGNLSQAMGDDVDGDGFTNGQEDALGQEPTIFDEVEDGGVPARRSSMLTYADTSMVRYTMKSNPLGFVETTERFIEVNGTTTTSNLHGESNGYTFAYWSVNGVRQAAGAGVAVSQVTTRVEQATVAIAHYLPTAEDSDTDGVADWFELNQFGDLNSGPDDDADGDNFSNAQEEALGQEATIRDEVEDGGVTARRSKVITYADTSMVAYTMKSTPAGFVEESTGYVEQNASITTTNLHGETNGYTFAYWAVNGLRQVSPNGLSLSQVTVPISATTMIIAHYLPTGEDNDTDGVEDWFEIYQFGDLSQSRDDDMDGDGFSNRQENEMGQEALIIDEVEDGGVTSRRSKSILYFEQQNYAPSGLELNNSITFINLPGNSLVGGFTPTDLNDVGLADAYTYTLLLTGTGGEDSDQYSLSASGGSLYTGNVFSTEGNHSIRVRVTDKEGAYLDKNFIIHVLSPTADPDGDGLNNQQEWIAGTRHDKLDTDGDGFSDGEEISSGKNPLDASDFPNTSPSNLNSTALLVVLENQPVGTMVGEFIATDPDSNSTISYLLVSGAGDTHNSSFNLDINGTLTTATVLDCEAGASLSIRVEAKDQYNAKVEGVFTVIITNDLADDVVGTFTVSAGQHEFPYFQFTDADGNTPDFSTLRLQKGAIYEFVSSNIASGHTFMIGESYGDTSSEHVTGNTLNSYQNGQKLTLSIPADFSGELYYFCTYHSHMVQPFLVGRKVHTVELNSSVSLEMIWVEPGTFMMGSPETEEGRNNAAGGETQHEVTLTKGFYLGKYEVTQAQYESVMAGNDKGWSATPSQFRGSSIHPVDTVSWDDVQNFLSRLNNQESENIANGWAYVLPTEAQWEYACRAGTTTAYSWGDTITSDEANYEESGFSRTREVGRYNANPWGFHDMHGNLWEFTADASGSLTSDSQTNPFNTSGTAKLARGGSWWNAKNYLRAAHRYSPGKTARSSGHGFRLAFRQITEPPIDLNSVAELTVPENQSIGTIVGEFTATDPDGDEIIFHLVSGEGDGNNSLFTLDQNGTLKTATVLDYEASEMLTIRVQAKDELNATVEGIFTVRLLDSQLDNTRGAKLKAEGGIISWIKDIRFILDPALGIPVLDSNGTPLFQFDTQRVFKGEEDFIFPEQQIILEPTPDPGNVFTYWLVDGVPQSSRFKMFGNFFIENNGTIVPNIQIEANETMPSHIQAVFSPLPTGDSNQSLQPIAMPVIDLVAHPQLKPAKITSVGGTVSWVSDMKFVMDPRSGEPILNNRWEPQTSFITQKVFTGEEHFIFPNEQIGLEPTPDPGNVFTYWLVDGVPRTESRTILSASLQIEANETMPSHIQAVFSPLPTGDSNQSLQPIAMPVIDLVAHPQLKPAKITSVGGTVSWVSDMKFVMAPRSGEPILNNRLEPQTSFITQKVFTGEEDFVFPNEQIGLEPSPDPGNVFTYWLVDGVPRTESRTIISASLQIEANETMPSHIQAVFSPLPTDDSNQSLKPIAMPVIDLVAQPQLKPAKITSVGGAVSWVGGLRFIMDPLSGEAILDSTGMPLLHFDTQKVFIGDEDFIFPNEQVQLEPTPDPGNVFTYWLVDGVPRSESKTILSASLQIEANETMPSHIQAVFSPLPTDGSSDQDLRPMNHANLNFITGSELKSLEILAKNGTVSWFEDLRFMADPKTSEPIIDEKGEWMVDVKNRKFFRVIEAFNFPAQRIGLNPIPDDGFGFDHWLVDGQKADSENKINLVNGVSWWINKVSGKVSLKNSLSLDLNNTSPSRVEAVFREIKFQDIISDGKAGVLDQLKIRGQDNLTYKLKSDARGDIHHFVLEANGSLKLVEDMDQNGTHILNIQAFRGHEPVEEDNVTITIRVPPVKSILDANTSDPAYHESALMIRELKVVRDDWRNGHNPISSIGAVAAKQGLFVTTAQPHGRQEGDSVVLSGVEGLEIEGVKNWNFMIDEVSRKSFRIRHFGKNEMGQYDGTLGALARPVAGTMYQADKRDYLLGPWTFGHLIGNMVGEQDDPVTFYKHFVDQWNHNQVVNGWDSGVRSLNRFTARNDSNLTLANLPFRLLSIGNRLDLFHAQSMNRVDNAGEGRFVFTNVSTFNVPENEDSIWKVHEEIRFDKSAFTLIFEYGQPAKDFATLARWAKDWHQLEMNSLDHRGNFVPTAEYLSRLNRLTDRFTKRGADPGKPNGNPINQVRTNEFLDGVWQMREFNLMPRETAEKVGVSTGRKTRLKVDEELGSIDLGLWTTTTKNNPMVGNSKLKPSLENALARWINQRENHILDGEVSQRAPEWMEGPVANQPMGFSYKVPGVRMNLARYKMSLSTCSGCHTGDTGTFFQMIKSQGKSNKAFYARFMVGDGKGGESVVRDNINFNEKHGFFDLQGREVIVRDILTVAEQVDAARLRLTRVEVDGNSTAQLAKVFVRGGVIGDWKYELPANKLDNNLFRMDGNGNLFFQSPGAPVGFGSKQIHIRATATDGTGVMIERPYSLWVLKPGESRLAQDLDPSVQPNIPPPLATPRPNRTH